MLSDEVRARIARLSALTRSSGADRPHDLSAPRPQAQPLAPQPATAAAAADPAARPLDLSCELSQAQVRTTSAGEHLLFRRPLAALSPAVATLMPGLSCAPDSAAAIEHPELAAVAEHFPAGAMFLDLETCGFAGSPVFLAGVVWCHGGELVLDQLFARSYAEERALLETLWSIAREQRVLATFNGKTFDWPMVCDRSTRHRLAQRPVRRLHKSGARVTRPFGGSSDELIHCDLLHHARRRWRRVLPDCRLQTLERYVCRRVRHNDLPGSEVPVAYHQYVRSGAAEPIRQVLLHNALDLVTLVELTLRLIYTESQPRYSAAG